MKREHKKRLTNAELRTLGLTPGLVVRKVRKPPDKISAQRITNVTINEQSKGA